VIISLKEMEFFMGIAYLDNSSTTFLCEAAKEKMIDILENFQGNPSSLHLFGAEAQRELNLARKQIAVSLGCLPEEICFTSGGTEANNLAIFGAVNALKKRGNRIVSSKTEHESVLQALSELEKQGFEVIYLSPNKDGSISEDSIFEAVNEDTILVSLMLINNETGAINPLSAARSAIKRTGSKAVLHCDAVQAYMKIPLSVKNPDVDLLSISSHKIHGPKGVGALYIKKGIHIKPLIYGGGQEKGMRAGTESLHNICGFAKASEVANLDDMINVKILKDKCVLLLSEISGVIINTCSGAPNIINISILNIPSEVMLHFLEERGVFVSSGSACKGNKKSHVLQAMGLDEKIVKSAIRISLCRYNTDDDIKRLVDSIKEGIKVLYK
jgi:cysteine desulfurase